MSGLVGVWHLDGRPSNPALVTTLAATIAHRGRDHSGIWSDRAACFACQLLRATPESAAECQPAVDADGYVLLFDGRLDNRDEIRASITAQSVGADLRVGPGGAKALAEQNTPDSSLILAAWREHGQDCLATLQGDFALALFDPRAQRLVLARDPIGCRPLYYWSNSRTVIVASEIKAILAHPDVRAAPNADLLADFFLLDRLPYDDDGETFFEGIQAIRPGWWVRVAPHHARSGRFWDFDTLARIRYASYSLYADRLRELLIQAVKRRLRSRRPIAVAVSGGLDSSIVLCIADDLCRRGDSNASLLPLSYTARGDPASEEDQFLDLLESERHLHVRRVAVGDPGAPDQLAHAAWHSEWPRLDDGWFAQQPMLEAARAAGASGLLSGLWADQLAFSTGYLTDLCRALAWREVGRHLEEYRRWFVDADPSYFRRQFRRHLLASLIPSAVRARLRPLRAAIRQRRALPNVAHAWAARTNRSRQRVDRAAFATTHARHIYQVVRTQAHRLQFEADEKAVGSYTLESMSPFLDRDVIAFLMGIPGDVQTRDGVPRALLRDAVRGIVPDPILTRRWRDETRTSAARCDRHQAYLSRATPLSSCAALGFAADGNAIANTIDLVGLEIWSQVFFSGKLTAPQLGLNRL